MNRQCRANRPTSCRYSPVTPPRRQRLIVSCVQHQVITEDQRFSLHDLKCKGGTDTAGTITEKQQAIGVAKAMMKVYDHSLAAMKPSDTP